MRLGGNASLRSSSSGYAASSDRCSGQGVGKAWVDDHRVISDIIQMLKSRRWADAPSTTAVYNHYDRCGEIPAVSLLSFAAPVASRSFSDNRKKRPLRCDGLLLWSRAIQGRQGAAPPSPSHRRARRLRALGALADRIANSLPCHDAPEQLQKSRQTASMRTCSDILLLSNSLSIT